MIVSLWDIDCKLEKTSYILCQYGEKNTKYMKLRALNR